jgi:hypothetical protein
MCPRSCLEDIAGLFKLLSTTSTEFGFEPTLPLTEIDQKADSLTRNLCGNRAYVTGTNFDPRFLVFEFQSGVLLRSRQVSLSIHICMYFFFRCRLFQRTVFL